ncbi:hypothetical protein BDZ91DRAFT_713874 [Kalaharituber pfeilii]|nr:hypothetical protein BDZ91DRAFT_713874 [Kalaharituber pfeilii]
MAGSELLSYVGWAFLPSFITTNLQSFLYRLFYPVDTPRPHPGQPLYAKHHRILYTLVVICYLLLTIYDTYHRLTVLTPNLYSLFSVPISVSEKALRVQWRKLNLMYHPDKGGSEEQFLVLQRAYETIADPVRRFGYDRFGEAVGEWGSSLKSVREVVVQGMWRMVPGYLFMGMVLVVLSVLGKLEFGRYWRFVAFFSLLIIELYLITHPTNLLSPSPSSLPFPLSLLSSLLPPLLPFEQLILIRKLVFSFFIALSQIGPMFVRSTTAPTAPSKPSTASEAYAALRPYLAKLQALANILENQSNQALAAEFMPFQGDKEGVERLEEALEGYIVEGIMRGDEEVREALGRAMREKRERASLSRATGLRAGRSGGRDWMSRSF